MRINRTKRNVLAIRIQVVYALAAGLDSLSLEEREVAVSSFLAAARNFKCTVYSCRCEARWLEAHLDIEAGFDLPKAMTNLKAVTSRQVHRERGGPAGIWASGYAALSVGDAVEAETLAESLCETKDHL